MRRDHFWVAGTVLGYFAVAWVTLSFRHSEGFTAIWPATGILLSALLLARRGLRPWLVGLLFLANLGARLVVGDALLFALALSLAEVGGAVLSVWLLHRFVGERITLVRVREVAWWLLLSVVLSDGVASLLKAGAFSWFAGSRSFWHAWLWSFTPMSVGNLLVTPLILGWAVWARTRWRALSRAGAGEFVALFVLAPVVNLAVLSQFSEFSLLGLLIPSACFPFILWAALRFGMRGVATILVEAAVVVVVFGTGGRIPALAFTPGVSDNIVVVQLALVVLTIPLFLLTAAIAERTETEASAVRANRALRLISACKMELVRATSEADLLQAICRLAVVSGGYRMAWVGLAEADAEKSVHPVAVFGSEKEYLNTVAVTWADTERGRGPTGTAIRGNQPIIANDLASDPTYGPWRQEALERGFAAAIALPLAADGRVLGALNLYADRADAFDPEEAVLLAELAGDLAFGITGLRLRQEQEAARDALRASEVRYRRLFESAKDGILILDVETGLIEDVNPYLLELLRFSREEMLGKHVWDLGFFRDIVANQAHFQELAQRRFIRYDDKALETRDGERIEVEFVSNLYLVNGRPVIQCNIRNMTESKRAQAVLEASQRLTRDIIDALPIRVFWKDRNLAYLGCNAIFARDAGLADPQDIIGKDDHQLAWRAQATAYQADDRLVIDGGQPRLLIEESQTTPDGNTIMLLTSKVPLRDMHGEVSAVLGSYLDITSLKRAEASEARLAMAVQQVAETIVVTDVHGTILEVNPAFEQTSGYTREEAIGQNPRMLSSGKHDTEFYRRMWATLIAGQVWQGRLINRRKDGTLYHEEVTISPMRSGAGDIVNYVAVKRDVTKQELLEAQLRRAQRMESIGTMAGGVAHDLNNALAPILMATELLRAELPESATEELDLIEAGARRGADLVKQLLGFAVGAEGERVPVEMRPLLREVERLVRGTFPKNIELQIYCPKDLPPILGDATQLHQVLLNLLVNARDAMPDGGTLSIDARTTEVDITTVETEAFDVKPGSYVVLQVTDTGSGMPPEILERSFDPFFTTKGPTSGTGLGLATTLGIIKGHAGFIRAYSVVGEGTTFKVYLPSHDAAQSGPDSRSPVEVAFRGHGETILVVDDEPAVRNILRRVLTAMNFKVVTATDGTSALLELSTHRTELAAIITDLHMPQLDGLAFVRLLEARSPEIGVIVASGLVGEREREQFLRLGVKAFLGKPFTQADLVEALRIVFVG